MREGSIVAGVALSLLLLLVLVPAPASADPYVGGIPLETTESGTVSGGLWHDSFVGTGVQDTDITKTYTLPSYTEIRWARLYVAVYCGHMQNNYEVRTTVKFDGGSGMQTLGVEDLHEPYSFPADGGGGPVWVNGHCNRVTGDYLMWYDVTDRITGKRAVAGVKTERPQDYKGTVDGRIKLVTLVVAYDDGDGDEVHYWVNQGHDVHSYFVEESMGDRYEGETTFDTDALPDDDEREAAAELSVIHLASHVGDFWFNSDPLDADRTPQGAYSGYLTWDVSDLLNPGAANMLVYSRDTGVAGGSEGPLGAFFKIPLALLSVRYPEEEVGSIRVTSTPAGAAIFIDGEATRWTTNTTIPDISAGDHSVRVELDRYRVPDDRWFTVSRDKNATVHFALEAITGSINVTSEPSGAWVYLDGENMSVVTPAILENLIVGDYTVEVKAEGYDDCYRTVTVSEGKTTSVDFKFQGAGDDSGGGEAVDYGYTGKRLDVAASGTLHGNLTYYDFGSYTGLIPAGESREFAIDIPAPANGTIRYARLYVYTTWGHDEKKKEGTTVRIDLSVDGRAIRADRTYNDRKYEGIYNYLIETHAFNVTGIPGGIAGEHVVKVKNDGRKDDLFAAYGVSLLVVTEDPDEPETTYWIAEGSDAVFASSQVGTTSEDCTTTAVFEDPIDPATTGEARLILVSTAGSGMGNDEHRILFNDGEWFNLLAAGSSAVSVADLDARPFLRQSANEAGIQSLITATKGDYMENRAIILVVRKGSPPEGYEMNATPTTSGPGTPAVSADTGSRIVLDAANGRIGAMHITADGGAVDLYIPEGAAIVDGAKDPVSVLVLQRLRPGDAGGVERAYAVGSDDMASDIALTLTISADTPGGVIARYDRSSGTWQPLETRADAAGGTVSAQIRQGGTYAVRHDGHAPAGHALSGGLLNTLAFIPAGGLSGRLLEAVTAFLGLFGIVPAGEVPAMTAAPVPAPTPGSVPAALEPAPAPDITAMRFALSVLSDPPGALVDIDGEYTGRATPAAFASLPGGNHTVRVHADGAEPVEETILLDHDDEVFIEFPGAGTSPAGPLRTWEQNHYGGVYVDSFPAGADILVDGQKVNRKTPDIVYGLKEGLHTIKLRKENTAFSSEKEQVWVERNTITRVTFASGNADLVRSITFDSEDCAQKPFSVNGRYLGDRLPKKVDVRGIGGAYITVRDSESYRSYRIPATAGSNDTVTVTLPDAPCSLFVTSVPAGAAIAVDGFLTGFATPYVIENISEGKHRIAVSKPGHIPAEREVLLTDGYGDTTVKVTLEPYVWGSLAVSSTPPDAKIYLFGRDTGEVTPHTFHYLDIGSYPVKVVGKEGSKTIEGVLVSPHAVAGCHADLTGE